MQTDAEVAAIAVKLTQAEMSLLLEHDDWFRVFDRMFVAGLFADGGDPMPHLTPLGTRVAQHLKQENAK